MHVLGPDEALPSDRATAVTIGVYDGVHIGHRWLLRKLRRVADQSGLDTALVTFHPHPLQVLRAVAAPRLLTDISLRLRVLGETGLVDHCLVLPFDHDLSRQLPDEFVNAVLSRRLHAGAVVVGADFHFGADRAGDTDLLATLGKSYGFATTAVSLVPVASIASARRCSSTYLRALIARGDVAAVCRLLQRDHEIRGRVVGTSRPTGGRGTPTVVVRVDDYGAVPSEGSYAGDLVTPGGRVHATGISVRQGMTGHDTALLDLHVVGEFAHLMDGDVQVRFKRRIWTIDKPELYATVVRENEDTARAIADAGWASIS